jgi:hypothetical protein
VRPRAAGTRLVAVPGLTALGAATGVGTIAFHSTWSGLVAGSLATLGTMAAVRAGWRRSGYAVGWLIMLVCAVMGRPEGDWAVGRSASGYLLLGLGLVVAGVAVATLPKPRGRSGHGSVESGNPRGST